MSLFLEQLYAGLGTFIISIFLPKHFTTFIRELLKFMFKSIIKYWYILFFIIVFTLLLNYKLLDISIITILISIIILDAIIVSSINLYIQFNQKYNLYNVAFYGCFSVKKNEYLTIDIDSENLTERFERRIEEIHKNHYSYRNKVLENNIIKIPKFICIILGLQKLNAFIQKRIILQKHIASIHFIRNINNQELNVIINFDRNNINNTSIIDNAENLISNLSSDSNINNFKIIDISALIYFLVFGQLFNDMIIEQKKFKEVHYILDDSEKIISNLISLSNEIPKKDLVIEFCNYWMGYIERYRAVLLMEQESYSGAIQHIIKSINYNPYFPYSDYATLKQDFTKKYGIELVPNYNNLNNEINYEDDIDFNSVKNDLEQQINFIEVSFHYSVIKEILQKNNTQAIRDELDRSFSKLDQTNPFVLLIISEIIKHMEKGSQKYNEIYIDRIDETVTLLKKVLEIDNDFPLIHTKIGTLMCIKGFHYDNEKIIEEGFKEYNKGIHIMSRLGFTK